MNGYRIIAKKIDPELAHEFGKLPRLPYGVTPIPEFKAPSQTTAYYQPGAPSAGRPGQLFCEYLQSAARPKWEMEALSLHESVPGHHLQISLAQEMEERSGIPQARWLLGVRGGLGAVCGESRRGSGAVQRSLFEIRPAQLRNVARGAAGCRYGNALDGLDARNKPFDFFRENTGKTDQDIIVEVDRYIVWPGQALAYKLGQLKIRELRTHAEKTLGNGFDIRSFHDAVLEEGAMPLDILEAHMNAWLARQSAKPAH